MKTATSLHFTKSAFPLPLLLLLTALPLANANALFPSVHLPRYATQSAIEPSKESQFELESSDPKLSAAFAWARQQALAYAFNGDPVGDWYEAALPGREAFCMRDVSHQSMGAHALGLAPHSFNMLKAFASSISDSKEWCSYWEINRFGRPAPIDYQSDAKFWYDLPANFDVLDACWRMYLWTGNLQYVDDPVFLNFYDRTVSDYVERWSLDIDHVMKRKRPMNVRGELSPYDKFQISRGIPGYEEGKNDFVAGVDLLASEYAAFRDYSQIQGLRGNFDAALGYANKARAVQQFLNSTWWDQKNSHFYNLLDESYHLQGHNGVDLLYYRAAEEGPRAQAALNDLVATIRANPSGPVELESHYPEVLYRYGAPELAYSQIIDLTRKGRYRREYPEVSFSVVGAIMNGLMGISVEAPAPDQSAAQWDFLQAASMTRSALLLGVAPPVQWNYVEVEIKTLPALTNDTPWAQIRHLPVRANKVSVKHEGNQKTTFTNESGPALIWHSALPGTYANLIVDGQPIKSSLEKEPSGRMDSWVEVTVGAGDTVTVESPKSSTEH